MGKKEFLKLIYLYLFSALGLILLIIGSVKLLDLGFRTFVFKKADIYYVSTPIYPDNERKSSEEVQKIITEQQKAEEINRTSQKQREISSSLAMILVGASLYFYHWHLILKNRKEN